MSSRQPLHSIPGKRRPRSRSLDQKAQARIAITEPSAGGCTLSLLPPPPLPPPPSLVQQETVCYTGRRLWSRAASRAASEEASRKRAGSERSSGRLITEAPMLRRSCSLRFSATQCVSVQLATDSCITDARIPAHDATHKTSRDAGTLPTTGRAIERRWTPDHPSCGLG